MKFKEIKSLSVEERKKRMEELKLELVRSRVGAAKGSGSKVKEIKKAIARINTLDRGADNGEKEVKLLKRKISKGTS